MPFDTNADFARNPGKALDARFARHSQTRAQTKARTEFFSLADGRQRKTAGATHVISDDVNAVTDPRSGDRFFLATVCQEKFLSSAVSLRVSWLSASVE
jgi:hypothetical protein